MQLQLQSLADLYREFSLAPQAGHFCSLDSFLIGNLGKKIYSFSEFLFCNLCFYVLFVASEQNQPDFGKYCVLENGREKFLLP